MFGIKLFTQAKSKKNAKDKNRKQYYAIRDYYRKKNRTKRAEIFRKDKRK